MLPKMVRKERKKIKGILRFGSLNKRQAVLEF
jgi:hypothetical protein